MLKIINLEAGSKFKIKNDSKVYTLLSPEVCPNLAGAEFRNELHELDNNLEVELLDTVPSVTVSIPNSKAQAFQDDFLELYGAYYFADLDIKITDFYTLFSLSTADLDILQGVVDLEKILNN